MKQPQRSRQQKSGGGSGWKSNRPQRAEGSQNRRSRPQSATSGDNRKESAVRPGARPNARPGTRQPREAGAPQRETTENRAPARRHRPTKGDGGAGGEHKEIDYVFGRHPVLEAVRSGRAINKLIVAEGTEGTSISEIVGKARDLGVIVQHVPRAKLDQLAQHVNHQGIIAYMAAKDYVEVEDIVETARLSTRPGLIIALDEVEDPFNLGSILRSADGGGAHGVILPKRRSVPLTGAVSKASVGAIEHVPVARVANLNRCIEKLKESGYWIVGADAEGEQLYTAVDFTEPTVLVIGGEGKGLSRLVKQQCDHVVHLPMVGQINSLNAGVATGILVYEVLRQRGMKSQTRT